MQTLGLAPAPSPPPATAPLPVADAAPPKADAAPPLARTQIGMSATGGVHLPLRPSAPDLLVQPLAPHEGQLAGALTDAADRAAGASPAPRTLAAALSATAPRPKPAAASDSDRPARPGSPVANPTAPAAAAPTLPPSSPPLPLEAPAGRSGAPPKPGDALGAPNVGGKAAGAAGDAASALPFGDLLDDIDDGFDRIVQQPGAATTPPLAEDYGEVKALFAEIAATHMGPVRDFMIELRLGDPPREWLELVLPAVRSLRASAAGMGLGELVTHLEAYVAALEIAATLDEPRVGGEASELLTASYAGLVAVMPAAFGLDEERDRREPIIVQSLLKQVPEVRKVALDKLYAAGLTSLSMYYVAKPYDIAEATGLSREVAARIIERFARYREDVADLTPDAARSRERAQLADLRRRLAELNEDFELASRERSPGAAADKRRLRGERNEVVLQIDVLLARLGEVSLVERLERLPFHGKVAALDGYLAEGAGERPPSPTGPGKAR